MPLVPIPIDKGVYKNVDSTSVATPQIATDLKNIVIDDTGANIDRPGLAATPFGQTGAAHGLVGIKYFEAADRVIMVDSNRSIWSMDEDGVTTNIGTTSLAGTAGRAIIEDDGEYVAVAGGGQMQRWNGTGLTGTFSGSPPDTTHIGYLDGYWVSPLLDDQENRIAGPTAVARTTWSTGDFFSAEGLPDTIRAQAVLLRELYSFGRRSAEIFQNFGGANPFQRTFFVDRGIAAPYSLIKWDNSLSWLDNERRIVRLEGRTPVQISAPIHKIISDYGTVDDCWSAYMQLGGFDLVMYVFPTEGTAWAYNPKRQEWYEWDGFTGPSQDRFPMGAHVFVEPWNKNLIGDPYTGIIRELTFDAKVDGDKVLRRMRRMRYKHGTGNRKKSNYYLFHVKTGVGTSGGTEPVFEVRVNDDNKGWSNWKQVPLGFPGAKQEPLRVRMGGIYRERQLEFQMTEPYEFALTAIEEHIEVMSS